MALTGSGAASQTPLAVHACVCVRLWGMSEQAGGRASVRGSQHRPISRMWSKGTTAAGKQWRGNSWCGHNWVTGSVRNLQTAHTHTHTHLRTSNRSLSQGWVGDSSRAHQPQWPCLQVATVRNQHKAELAPLLTSRGRSAGATKPNTSLASPSIPQAVPAILVLLRWIPLPSQ